MGKRRLSKSEIKALNARLERLGFQLSKKDAVEILDDENGRSYLMDGSPWLFERDGELIPHLRLLQDACAFPKVTVDKGAVKFIVNGADVMRPGVRAVDDGIVAGTVVAVVDETHGKPLAVGTALMGTAAILAATGGKVVTTIHHVGDKHWDAHS